jgi:Hemolysin-coregulated protein (uncharacterized)
MAVDYFLKIDGIPGESTDRRHNGEIVVDSFSLGETNSGGSVTGGGGAGKVSFQDFHFTAKFTKASPKLMLACATGVHIPSAILTGRKAGGFDFLFVKMHDVLVSSFQTGESGGTVPEDAVSLAFAKIEVDYKEQKATGSLGATTRFSWDLRENKAG